jgi:hypothetical protein
VLKSQKLMVNFKSKKWAVPLLVVLIVLAIGVFLSVSLGIDFWKGDFKARVLGSIARNPFRRQSQVKASLVDSKISLSFDLIEEDKLKFVSFINNWFGVDEEIQTLSFGIDDNLATMVSQNLPVNLNLKVSDKSIEFNSLMVAGLQNTLVKNDIEFATGSSKLNAQVTDSSKYQIRIDDPEDLLNYATASGMLTTSAKIEGLFKTFPKVATIELNVNGKNISGKIVLK